MSAVDWSVTQAAAERLFGPHNPRAIQDWVLKLMSTDWSIGFAREIWLSAFHAVEYQVEGGDPRIRAFVEQIVERHLWQWIESMLRSLEFGRQACELVWSVEDVAIKCVDPLGEAGAPEIEEVIAAAYVLEELRDLDPEMVDILADEKTGDYRGIRYGGVELPGAKTLLVTNDMEFGNLRGRSMHVRSYNPWWWGNLAYLGVNRYLEKKGDPPLIGFAPGEEVADEDGNMHDPVETTAVGLSNARSGSIWVFPQEFDPDSKQPLYSVRALEVANRAPEFLEVIDRHEANKRLGWLIPGSLGGGEGGSFASDKVAQQLVHRLFDRRKQRLVLDPINKHVIPKLVGFNFGDVTASAVPRLAAGNMAEDARELFAEILRSAAALETITPDGRRVRVIETIDMYRGLRTLGLPRVPYALIPDPVAFTAPGGDPEGKGFPTAGQPPSIAPETDRPNAPGRPGQSALGLAAKTDPDPAAEAAEAATWLEDLDAGLLEIGRTVQSARKVSDAHAEAIDAQVRARITNAVAALRTKDRPDGVEAIASAAKASDAIEREVTKLLDAAIQDNLLDVSEIPTILRLASEGPGGATLALASVSPLALIHANAYRDTSKLLATLGIEAPSPAAAKKIIMNVAADARRNGKGIVQRESRRAAETVHRLVTSGQELAEADRVAAAHEIRTGDFASATVDHVRATARATLAWGGEKKGATSWVAALGPDEEREVIDGAPKGQVADLVWKTYTTAELDALYKRTNADRATWSSWRDLGIGFASPEMYVPLPLDVALAAAVNLAIAARRRAFDEARKERQAALDGLNAKTEAEKAQGLAAKLSSFLDTPPPEPAPDPALGRLADAVAAIAAKPGPDVFFAAGAFQSTTNIQAPAPSPAPVVNAPINIQAPLPVEAPPPPPINVHVEVDARGGSKTVTLIKNADGSVGRAEIEPRQEGDRGG